MFAGLQGLRQDQARKDMTEADVIKAGYGAAAKE